MDNKSCHRIDVKIDHQSDLYGEIAIQGPKAESIIIEELNLPVADLEFYSFSTYEYNGDQIIISRTGYTGEDGFEILCKQCHNAKKYGTH